MRRRRILVAVVAVLLVVGAGVYWGSGGAGPRRPVGTRPGAAHPVSSPPGASSSGGAPVEGVASVPIGSIGLFGSHCVAVLDGDGFFVSDDSGGTWSEMVPPTAGDPLADIAAADVLDADDAWMVAGQRGLYIDATHNGGKSWDSTPVGALVPRGFDYSSISFSDASDGWVSIQPYSSSPSPTSVVLSSTDGGATWRMVDPDAPVLALQPVTSQVGWGLSADGITLYRTSDGGVSWQVADIAPPSAVAGGGASAWRSLSMPVFSGADGVLLAVPDRGRAVVEITEDAGLTWRPRPTPFTVPAPAAQTGEATPPPAVPFAVVGPHDWIYWAGHRLYVTKDTGRTWASFEPVVREVDLGAASEVVGGRTGTAAPPLDFSSATDGWAVATNDSDDPRDVLLATQDGGRRFTEITQPTAPLPPPPTATTIVGGSIL
jgi:photosystem II stability/assembly factor-like uncharacterized protein